MNLVEYYLTILSKSDIMLNNDENLDAKAKKFFKNKKKWAEGGLIMKNNILFSKEELPQEATQKIRRIWQIFFMSVIGVAGIIFLLFHLTEAILASLGIFISLCLATLIAGWTQIPYKTEFIIEIYGRYIGVPLVSGFHLIFPFFGLITLRKVISKKEQMLGLHLYEKNDEEENPSQGGDIEFLDGSSSIRAFFYYLIEDSEKAIYNVEDYLRFIEEKGALRVFLGTYTIDEVIRLKNIFTLEGIILGRNWLQKLIDAEDDTQREAISRSIETAFEKTAFYTSLKTWGIVPKALVISDIELTELVKAQRQRKLVAEKDLQVKEIEEKQAKIQKRIKVILATGDKLARIRAGEGEKLYQSLYGEGVAMRIEAWLGKGIPAEQISALLSKDFQWSAVGNSKSSDKTIILGGDTKDAGRGAEFAAGFSKASSQKGPS